MTKKARRRLAACIIYVIFIILKWVGVVTWPWLAVLSPLIAFGGFIAFVLALGISIVIVDFFF